MCVVSLRQPFSCIYSVKQKVIEIQKDRQTKMQLKINKQITLSLTFYLEK